MLDIQHPIQSSVSNMDFDETDKNIAKTYIQIGYAIIGIFFGSIVAWAAFAPISSAAIAPGLVSKDGYRKTVQHLEGGIIHKIFVTDGDKVTTNQKLIELENIQSRSDFDLLRKQKLIARTKEICLKAELNNENQVILPASLNLDDIDESVRDAIQGQINTYYVQRDLKINQLEIIDQRIKQAHLKITALKTKLLALRNKGAVINQELKQYRVFEKKGYVTRSQVFSLRNKQASNQADITSTNVSIETTLQDINDLQMEKAELNAKHSKRIVLGLEDVRKKLVDLDEKIAKTEDRFERTIIRAPIDGVIVDLKVNTIQGVVKPGESLLDIVPEQGKLVIEAQINPKDRDTVRVGQEAEVRFLAFNQRITEPVKGRLVLISADRLLENSDVNGRPSAFYKAKVELLEDPSEVMNGAPVFPGMQADVMIVTGSRTALDYFLKPITKSFNRAFRDD